MSDEQWEVATKTPEAVLSHRSCPWGGHLIKIESKNVFVENPPEDPCNIFVRPEVRYLSDGPLDVKMGYRETYAPGDALLERMESMWIVKVASVLFGYCQGSFAQHWLHKRPLSIRYRLYKDCPEAGESIYVGHDAMYLAQPSKTSSCHYCMILVFSTPIDAFTLWPLPFLNGITEMFHKAAGRTLNGSFAKLRAIDAKMYMVLSIRSFNKGPPLIPQSGSSDDIITVSAGEHLGLVSWTRFTPGEKFKLCDYLRCFMGHLGHKMKTYQVMDGRKLVPYQCVVVRHEWEELRKSFFEAFRVQKAAYRHANGGTSTPSLLEDVVPRWVARVHDFREECAPAACVDELVNNKGNASRNFDVDLTDFNWTYYIKEAMIYSV